MQWNIALQKEPRKVVIIVCVLMTHMRCVSYLVDTQTTDTMVQLNRCRSVSHDAYHSHCGGDARYVYSRKIWTTRFNNNKVLYSLSSSQCQQQMGTWGTYTHTLIATKHFRCTIAVVAKEIIVRFYLYLPPSSRPDFSVSGLNSGLTNFALQRATFNLSLFNLPLTHMAQPTRTHTHTRSMFPIAVLISSPWSPSSSVRTERTHTAMNHCESCSSNSTQREVLHLTRTCAIYNRLGMHILIIGHRGCWQWTGRWGCSKSFDSF